MNKNILRYIFIIIIALGLCGCTTKYDKNDIEEYVKENLKLEEFEVSDTYEEVTGVYNDYTNNLWTVVDKKQNITFHVLDNYYYAVSFGTENNLTDDYEESLFMALYENMNKEENIEYNYNSNDGLNNIALICNYDNKDELDKCYNSLLTYRKYIENNNYDLKIPYRIEYNFSITDRLDNSYTGFLNNIDETSYQNMLIDYYKIILLYQADNMNEIGEAELSKIMNDEETYVISITRNDGTEYTYNDLISDSKYITYGTLYRILKYEGYKVTGSTKSFKVYLDNDTYEFSYDFAYKTGETRRYYYNSAYETEEITKYYYIHNNEKVEIELITPQIYISKINEMFNLNLSSESVKQKNIE